MDKQGHTTPSTFSASTMEERITRDVDVGERAKFRFLDGGDSDFAFIEKVPKFVDFS